MTIFIKILLFMIVIASLIACESASVRREETISQHPQWNMQIKQLIREGFLVQGMDKEQVKAAWGKPCWSCTGTTKGQWGEAWEYATQVVFFDTAGKVTRWEAK